MMDFATMLNRLFKKDIECRRRNLYVTVLPAKWKGSQRVWGGSGRVRLEYVTDGGCAFRTARFALQIHTNLCRRAL